jgi:protein subunit release factor A
MSLDPKDLRVEACPPTPTGGMLTGTIPVGIKVTHIPTGITYAFCEHRSQFLNRQECFRLIEERINWGAK